jgi:hypothetical protein
VPTNEQGRWSSRPTTVQAYRQDVGGAHVREPSQTSGSEHGLHEASTCARLGHKRGRRPSTSHHPLWRLECEASSATERRAYRRRNLPERSHHPELGLAPGLLPGARRRRPTAGLQPGCHSTASSRMRSARRVSAQQ